MQISCEACLHLYFLYNLKSHGKVPSWHPSIFQ